MSELFDVVIVGSGPSGGRIAWDLVQAGARCLLLEAGQEFTARPEQGQPGDVRQSLPPRPFPGNERDYSTQMFWGGGIELSTDARMAFLRARCLGGTSVVNQALMDRFDDVALDDWRDRTGIDWLSVDGLEDDYLHVEGDVALSDIGPEHHNRNTRLFTEAFDKLGYGWKVLRRAQTDCALEKGSDCITCLGGCPRESKQSALVTTIRRAREGGMEVRTGCEVERIVEADGVVRISGTGRHGHFEVSAGSLVLAAGSLGTTRLLLRSDYGSRLPALGTGFSCHPQYMSYAKFDETIDAHKGAFQAVKSDDPKLRAEGVKFENVFAGPIGTSMLLPGRGAGLQTQMRDYRSLASMEVAIRDDAAGTMKVDRKGNLLVDKRMTGADRAKAKRGLQIVRELFEAVGATDIVQCTDTFGLHLMGGCPIGTDLKTSVVGPDFRVHGSSRIFTADSSIFPSAPGINPSLTIMALSHRASRSVQEAAA